MNRCIPTAWGGGIFVWQGCLVSKFIEVIRSEDINGQEIMWITMKNKHFQPSWVKGNRCKSPYLPTKANLQDLCWFQGTFQDWWSHRPQIDEMYKHKPQQKQLQGMIYHWLTLEPALSSPRTCLISFARTNLLWLKGGQVYKYACVNRFMSPCPPSKCYKHTPCTTCGSVLIHLSAWTIRETFGKHVQTFITQQSRWTTSVLVVVGKTNSK